MGFGAWLSCGRPARTAPAGATHALAAAFPDAFIQNTVGMRFEFSAA